MPISDPPVQDWARVNGSGSTVDFPFASDVEAGNFIAVALGIGDSGDDFSTVEDTLGNTYELAVKLEAGASSVAVAIYFCKSSVASGPCTITATFTTAVFNSRIAVAEYSGLDTSAPLDQTNSGSAGGGTAVNSGDVTTLQADELLIGVANALTGSLTYTPGSGWTEETDSGGVRSFHVQSQIVAATGTYVSDPTLSGSSTWAAAVATFKASAGGARRWILGSH